MKRLAAALLLAALPAMAQAPAPPLSPPDTWQPRGTAELLLLDKMRVQPTTVTVKTGQSTTFHTLTVGVRTCFTRPPDLPADSTAFLDVTDSRDPAVGFHGWMLANTPAVAQLEHPVYDIRLVACR